MKLKSTLVKARSKVDSRYLIVDKKIFLNTLRKSLRLAGHKGEFRYMKRCKSGNFTQYVL